MNNPGIGEIMLYTGIVGAVVSFLLLLLLRFALSAKERMLKKELTSEYFDNTY